MAALLGSSASTPTGRPAAAGHRHPGTRHRQPAELGQGGAYCHENKGIVLAVTGELDGALAELDTADNLAPEGGGEGRAWAGAILWHRHDAAGAQNRFARVAADYSVAQASHDRRMGDGMATTGSPFISLAATSLMASTATRACSSACWS